MTQYDLSKRALFGQTITEEGYINCHPDNYSIYMRQEILRYLVTIDVEERERAEPHTERFEAGEIDQTLENELLCEPQFRFVTPQVLMAIEFTWGVQSVSQQGFAANRIFYEITTMGKRYHPPALGKDQIRKDAVPAKRWLHVGSPVEMTGLRSKKVDNSVSRARHKHTRGRNTRTKCVRLCRMSRISR